MFRQAEDTVILFGNNKPGIITTCISKHIVKLFISERDQSQKVASSKLISTRTESIFEFTI